MGMGKPASFVHQQSEGALVHLRRRREQAVAPAATGAYLAQRIQEVDVLGLRHHAHHEYLIRGRNTSKLWSDIPRDLVQRIRRWRLPSARAQRNRCRWLLLLRLRSNGSVAWISASDALYGDP